MTHEEAARIIDPETIQEALDEIEYYGGFRGDDAVLEAVNEARRIAADVLRNKPTGESLTLERLRVMKGDVIKVLIIKTGAIVPRIVIDGKGKYIVTVGSDGLCLDSDEYRQTWLAYSYHSAHIDWEAWKCPLCETSEVISFEAWEDESKFPKGPSVRGAALFCPHCGKPRTPEAWAELEKRLRG